jgi:hypothetical protein
LREASTWRGLVWLLTVSGVALRPDQIEAIVMAGMAIAGLIGVFLRDEIRSSETRTRETDIPSINLVGRSESVTEPNPPPRYPDSGDELLDRMCRTKLQSHDEHQDPGSTLRQDGGGYNG